MNLCPSLSLNCKYIPRTAYNLVCDVALALSPDVSIGKKVGGKKVGRFKNPGTQNDAERFQAWYLGISCASLSRVCERKEQLRI